MMSKQSHWLFEILPLLDSELNLEEPMSRGKGWRRISPSYAVGRLPRFSGRPRFLWRIIFVLKVLALDQQVTQEALHGFILMAHKCG